MSTTAQNDQTAEQTAADADAKRVAKEQKARDAAEAKAEKARVAAAKKAAREQERINKTLTDGGVNEDDVDGSGPDGAITLDDAREAVKAKKAAERAAKEKKAPMTLSQRRAILKLGGGPTIAKTDFNRLPLDYLVGVGLAKVEDVTTPEEYTEKETEEYFEGEGDARVKKTRKVDVKKTRDVTRPQYSLTEKGAARVTEINPKWLTWRPDGASAGAPAPEPAASDPDPAA